MQGRPYVLSGLAVIFSVTVLGNEPNVRSTFKINYNTKFVAK